MYTYKHYVSMVVRLMRAGMPVDRAVGYVSWAYCCDADSLREWIESHTHVAK